MTARRILWVASASLFLATVSASATRAGIVQVFSRSDLGGNDEINWSTKGVNGALLSNPFDVDSTGGLGAMVSKDSAEDFQLLVQGASGGWGGNFSPGDTVLWTNSYPSTSFNAITLTFDSLVAGFGANMQQVNLLSQFTGVVEAYDASDTLLATFSSIGISNTNNDGSAVFLGMKSTETNIKRVRFYLTTSPFNYIGSYGINQVSLVTPRAVPEPTAFVSVLIGGLVVGCRVLATRRRRVAVA